MNADSQRHRDHPAARVVIIKLGIILIECQLRRRIEEAVAQRLSNTDVEALVRDCYELVLEFAGGMDRSVISIRWCHADLICSHHRSKSPATAAQVL